VSGQVVMQIEYGSRPDAERCRSLLSCSYRTIGGPAGLPLFSPIAPWCTGSIRSRWAVAQPTPMSTVGHVDWARPEPVRITPDSRHSSKCRERSRRATSVASQPCSTLVRSHLASRLKREQLW